MSESSNLFTPITTFINIKDQFIIMKCDICGEDIHFQCNDDDPKRISGKPVCEDCYYERLGEMMEQHPIGFPIVGVRIQED